MGPVPYHLAHTHFWSLKLQLTVLLNLNFGRNNCHRFNIGFTKVTPNYCTKRSLLQFWTNHCTSMTNWHMVGNYVRRKPLTIHRLFIMHFFMSEPNVSYLSVTYFIVDNTIFHIIQNIWRTNTFYCECYKLLIINTHLRDKESDLFCP